MTTVTQVNATRRDAMKFMAAGLTGAGMRDLAASDETAARLAAAGRDTPDGARKVMLGIADGIDRLAAEGFTPAGCRDLLDRAGIPGIPRSAA